MASNDSWTDAELAVAVEAYLYLFRLEQAGAEYSERDMAIFLLSGPLKHRNDASIRYRMRNISSVLGGRGWATVRAYSSAHQVGSGVKARIEAIIDHHSSTELACLQKGGASQIPARIQPPPPTREDVLETLDRLAGPLADLERDLIGIGHNNPPDSIHDVSLTATDVRVAREDAARLREQVGRANLDAQTITTSKARLAAFGLKIAAWLGERTTKFVDAALISIAPIIIAKATNVLPLISDAIGMLSRFLSH
jgi:hypothetical protein